MRFAPLVATLIALCSVPPYAAAQMEFIGVFDDSTMSASAQSSSRLGAGLQSFFQWANAPLFTTFVGSSGPTQNSISITFSFGSSDATANSLQLTYLANIKSYLGNDPNATSLKAVLRSSDAILLYSLQQASTVAPAATSPGTEGFLHEYYPAVIVGGIVVLVLSGVVVACVIAKRRSQIDARIFDTMEAMIDEDNSREHRGAHHQRQQPARPQVRAAETLKPEKDPDDEGKSESTQAVPPAPKPMQQV